ncbi:MAG TPA: DUF4861 family protein [Ignavibacteriaceae bacterium]
MKTIISITLILSLILLFSCSSQKSLQLSVTNQTSLSLSDVFVTADIDTSIKSFSVYEGDNIIPSQLLISIEKNEIGFILNLDPLETKQILIKKDTEKHEFKIRTFAELAMKPGDVYIDGRFRGDKFITVEKIKVPSIHTDHDALFKYEGPGWESEKVGYRFYLDWRNANDIFGKKANQLLLSNIGVHDTVAKEDSYHEMQSWGMDIFKVGNSLGIGSIGMWYDNKVNMVSKTDSIYCEIPENGPILSSVKTTYYGWLVGQNKYNLISTLSIAAGSRLTKCQLEISGDAENIVTGLAKYEGTDFVRNNGNGEWAYISLYGNQTLVGPDDKLGVAVFYQRNSFLGLTEDDLSYVVKIKPDNGRIEYYFCAAWEQEPNGIKNRNEFIQYLDDTLEELNNPPIVKIK